MGGAPPPPAPSTGEAGEGDAPHGLAVRVEHDSLRTDHWLPMV